MATTLENSILGTYCLTILFRRAMHPFESRHCIVVMGKGPAWKDSGAFWKLPIILKANTGSGP